eukprot:gb/GEZN01017581.1/.p1 GENE.gb/GEZN01017581.1/~~gb/GEZN01017581.1/.p1  ORF type:complete len:203 (+),score=20.40 gb/GEZN01017581.1/:97-705(+)
MSTNFKVVLLGEGRVGKTSLCLRYCQGTFSGSQESTITANYLEKKLHLRNQQMRIHIWDTAGQERFHSLGALYYRDAQGALLVYDVSDSESFQRVQTWVEELHKMASPNIALVIVGNKADKPQDEWQILPQEATKYAELHGAKSFTVSAKTGEGVDSAFLEIAKGMLLKAKAPDNKQKDALKIMEDLSKPSPSSDDSSRCCS